MIRTIILSAALLFAAGNVLRAQDATYWEVEPLKHDFGQVLEDGGTVEHSFVVRNTGDDPMRITYVKASCGCTTPEWTKQVIPPGETGIVKAVYNPKRRFGRFNKSITMRFRSGDKQGRATVRIMGEVVRSLTAEEKEKAKNLPVPPSYQEYFGYNAKDVSTSDKEFKQFIKQLADYIAKAGGVRLQIESSASHVPTETYGTNEKLARRRAEDTKKRLLDALSDLNVNINLVRFEEHDTKVQGPDYNNDYIERRAEYGNYQYVKIKPARL